MPPIHVSNPRSSQHANDIEPSPKIMNSEPSLISRTVPVGDDLEANRIPYWPDQTKNDGNDDGPNAEVAASVKRMKVIPSRWYRKVLDAGVEENGILPVPPEERTQTQHSNLFTVFFTCLLCVLPSVDQAALT